MGVPWLWFKKWRNIPIKSFQTQSEYHDLLSNKLRSVPDSEHDAPSGASTDAKMV
jgi:hypothetical protein